jgi:hypothetical protein
MKIVRSLVVAAFALVPVHAYAFGLPDAAPYSPNLVECMAGPGDVSVSSFGDVLTYQIKGTCKINPVHLKGAWVPAGAYDVVATWRASDGAYHEKLHGPQSIGQNVFEPQHGPWEMELEGTCKLDPFMTGADASSCSGHVISSSNAIFTFSEKNFPISPRVVPASLRPALSGKALAAIEAEHQAPKILKPEEGKTYSGPRIDISIDAGKDSPTKSFKLEWQVRLPAGWTPEPVKPLMGYSEFVATAALGDLVGWTSVTPMDWRMRARASQSSKAAWSDWRTFSVKTESKCATSGPYGASYGTEATPSSMTLGQTANVPINISNTGTKTWTVAGNFHLSYHWVQNNVPVVEDGQRTSLPSDVPSCSGTSVLAKLLAPPAPGTYTLEWDMVEEGVAWFSTKGVKTGNRTVTVSSSAAPQPPPPRK